MNGKKSIGLALFASILCISSGCEISTPPSVGSYCPGITQENILHTDSDQCSLTKTCAEEDAVVIRMGYCPPGFTCVETHGIVQCKHGCESGKVMCNGECIDPLISMTHCGASLGGSCSDIMSHSDNYMGEDCSKLQSNSRMVCTNGKCVPNSCEPEYHPELQDDGTTICKRDSKDACGSVDVKCKNTEVCKAGFCSESCPESQVVCNSTCIDPSSSKEFCGATKDCLEYESCKNGEVCSSGKCRILDCENENEAKCIVNETEQCIDVASDALNCGSCGHNCESFKPANASVVGCVQKMCIYQCDDGFQDCGSNGIMECVDLTGTKAHCGSCDNACVGKQFCKNSSCAENDCEDYQCPQADQCKSKDPEACGVDCVNCKTTYHAEAATCDDVGKCHVSVCANGYHLSGSEGSYTCEPNNTNSCGSTDKVDAVDCEKISNANVTTCEADGKCKVHSCSGDYHVLDNASCEKNDDNNCGFHNNKCQVNNGTSQCQNAACKTIGCNPGFHETSNICVSDDLTDCGGVDCSTITGWANGTCTNGKCKLVECRTGFHLVGSAGNYTCASNSKTSCGSTNKVNAEDCTAIANADSVSCENGICRVSSCKGDYHVLDNVSCQKNDDNNCGMPNHKCSVTNGTSKCQSGVCKTTGCDTGYHVENNVCVSDTITNCGGNNCSTYIANWLSGSCDKGTCKVSACVSGYHVNGNECENDSVTNCKSHGNTCSSKDSNGSSFSCDSSNGCMATSCKSGYHVYNNGCHNGNGSDSKCCEAHSNANCGSHSTICTKENASTVSCSDGTCKATACNTGYYLDGGNCIKENVDNCRTKNRKCSDVVTGWLSGTCSNGNCIATNCTSAYHVYNNACEANSNSACGHYRRTCSNTSYQIYNCTGSGEDATCTITGCMGDYHFYNNSCESNSVTNCGRHGNNCSTSFTGWGSGSCTNGKCVVSYCNSGKGYTKPYNHNICIKSCYSATSYGMSYCCPDSFSAENCGDTTYGSNCNQCQEAHFYPRTTYDYDYYESCLDEVLGTSYQYSDISCKHEACEEWRQEKAYGDITATTIEELDEEYYPAPSEVCYYLGY